MQRYIDTACLLSEARMMWYDYHCAYLLLEGTSDVLFISALMGTQPNVRLRVANGWRNVFDTVSKAEQEGFPYVAGIIDSDYHQSLSDQVTSTLQLLVTDATDIEMMMVQSHSFDKFLVVCGSCQKLRNIPDKRRIVMDAAFPLGVMRYLSLKNGYNLYFEGIEYKKFISKQDLFVDKEKMVNNVIERTRSQGTQVTVSEDDLLDNLNSIMEKSSPSQFCNGHDALNIICIAMTKLFATNNANTYTPYNVFDHLLMGYSREEFQTSQLYASLLSWITCLDP